VGEIFWVYSIGANYMFRENIKKQIILSGIVFGIIALLFGLWSQYNTHPKKPKELLLKNGTVLPSPREIIAFELKNAPDGTLFNNIQLKGHWSMLFFGFTHCALLCPTTLSSLNQFYGNLLAENINQMPQIYFISIDPERDSLQRIATYVTSFNKNFKGATGSEKQLNQITKELNILFAKVKPDNEDKEDYQIDHSGTILLINPDGNLTAFFSPPIEPKELTEDYKSILKSLSATEN
jgi:protein SCO1/2